MKTLLVASILFIGGAAPALADDPTPIACAVDSEGNESCPIVEQPPAVDPTEDPVLIDAPNCSEDMTACQRGPVMYNKEVMAPVNAPAPNNTENALTVFLAVFAVIAVLFTAYLLRKISDLNQK